MKYYCTIVLACIFSYNLSAQGVFGKWYSIDPDTGENESVIRVYQKGEEVFAKIETILREEDKDKTCIECSGPDKDKPIEGLVIMKGLKKDGDEYNGGKILDPKNGKYYKCYITLEEENKLKLRGYIGFSVIGRTEYWYRVEGK
jgi:uncharacterized protein (DUF2147 family)